MQSGRKPKDITKAQNQIKFTVGYNGSMAESISFYDQQTHLADDIPLKLAIENMAFSKKDVAVFDRGLKARKTFEQFNGNDHNHRLFVCRINPTTRFKVVADNELAQSEAESLDIFSDQIVHLYNEKSKLTKTTFRLIVANQKEAPNEKMFFVSNIIDQLNAVEVTDIYRHRWKIDGVARARIFSVR
jgi:hypothetical protein